MKNFLIVSSLILIVSLVIGFFFGVTVLDVVFFHSDEKGAIAGMILGTIVGVIIIVAYWIGIRLGIGKPKKCPRCGSGDTERIVIKRSPLNTFVLKKHACRACEHKWEK